MTQKAPETTGIFTGQIWYTIFHFEPFSLTPWLMDRSVQTWSECLTQGHHWTVQFEHGQVLLWCVTSLNWCWGFLYVYLNMFSVTKLTNSSKSRKILGNKIINPSPFFVRTWIFVYTIGHEDSIVCEIKVRSERNLEVRKRSLERTWAWNKLYEIINRFED